MQSTKIKLILILTILTLFSFQPVAAKTVRLKIHTLSPEGSMWVTKLVEGADEVAKKTDNRVKFKFYPAGQIARTDKMALKKIKIGQIHGVAAVSGSLSQFFPANQLYAQPMKFTSRDQVEYVRQFMDPYIIEGLEKEGFVTFGLIGGGFSYILSKNRIETLDDLRSCKVWIPDNDKINQDSIRVFGVNPISLPIADVRISLQTGLVDTVANSPMAALVLQWHTQVKYITEVPLIYIYAVLAIDQKRFSKISPADQQIVKEIMTKVSKVIQKQNMLDEQKAIQILKKRGIEFVTPNPEAMKQWQDVGDLATKKMIEGGVLPEDVVEEMDRHLETYKASGKSADAQ